MPICPYFGKYLEGLLRTYKQYKITWIKTESKERILDVNVRCIRKM